MLIVLLIICFLMVLCFVFIGAYITGYRKGRDKAAAHYGRLFAQGVRTWLIEDFEKNGELLNDENNILLRKPE